MSGQSDSNAEGSCLFEVLYETNGHIMRSVGILTARDNSEK